MYLVSILLPVYRVEKYIERCARSLFEQTYDNLEYIFVDDCSPDSSIAILNRVLEDYPERKAQVRIIRHERNRGLAAACNTALNAAQGSFLSHVDSDDYLDRDAIRLLVNKQVETGADIVTGNYYIVGTKGIKKASEPEYKDKQEMLLKALSSHSGTYAVWRRLINIRLYREHCIGPEEGLDFFEDIRQTTKLVYYANTVARINDHIYYYDRTNDHSYTSNAFNHSNIKLWRQSVDSVRIIEHFFSDKEQEYYDMARRIAICSMKFRMSLAAKYKEKAFFEEMKRTITSEYTDCYGEIGWNNPLVRAFMCNYTLNGVYRRFLRTIKIK